MTPATEEQEFTAWRFEKPPVSNDRAMLRALRIERSMRKLYERRLRELMERRAFEAFRTFCRDASRTGCPASEAAKMTTGDGGRA